MLNAVPSQKPYQNKVIDVKHFSSDAAAHANSCFSPVISAICLPPPLSSLQQLLQRIWLPHGAQVSGAECCIKGVSHSSVSIAPSSPRALSPEFHLSFTHFMSNYIVKLKSLYTAELNAAPSVVHQLPGPRLL